MTEDYSQPARQFFANLPDSYFAPSAIPDGQTRGATYGNPDIEGGAHRRRFFFDVESLDAYLRNTGLDSPNGSEYVFVTYGGDGSAVLYIAD